VSNKITPLAISPIHKMMEPIPTGIDISFGRAVGDIDYGPWLYVPFELTTSDPNLTAAEAVRLAAIASSRSGQDDWRIAVITERLADNRWVGRSYVAWGDGHFTWPDHIVAPPTAEGDLDIYVDTDDDMDQPAPSPEAQAAALARYSKIVAQADAGADEGDVATGLRLSTPRYLQLISRLSDELGVTLNDRQARCAAVINTLAPIYRWPTVGDLSDSLIVREDGLTLLTTASFSTYDDDNLTRLVLAAHQEACRVQIGPWLWYHDMERASRIAASILEVNVDDVCIEEAGIHALALTVTARSRDGSPYDRHPTIDEAIEAFEGGS
jgi:hypothetical protein